MASNTGKPATPMIGLGKPSNEACADSMIDPQLSTGLRLHVGT